MHSQHKLTPFTTSTGTGTSASSSGNPGTGTGLGGTKLSLPLSKKWITSEDYTITSNPLSSNLLTKINWMLKNQGLLDSGVINLLIVIQNSKYVNDSIDRAVERKDMFPLFAVEYDGCEYDILLYAPHPGNNPIGVILEGNRPTHLSEDQQELIKKACSQLRLLNDDEKQLLLETSHRYCQLIIKDSTPPPCILFHFLLTDKEETDLYGITASPIDIIPYINPRRIGNAIKVEVTNSFKPSSEGIKMLKKSLEKLL